MLCRGSKCVVDINEGGNRMIDFTLLFLGSLVLLGFWLIENFGVYLRWMAGCLIFVILLPVVGIGLVLLRDFLINL